MITFDKIIDMLHEFDYKKNGVKDTIHFLAWCIEAMTLLVEEKDKKKEKSENE